MRYVSRCALAAAGASFVLVAGCAEELDGPPPAVSGVEPRLVCAEQIETTVTIDGSALSPTVFDSLTDEERAILPQIDLTRSTDLRGESVEGSPIRIPDSEAGGQVRWTSATHMDFDVTPDLGLEPGVYDITITNPSAKSDTLALAIGAVPRPVIDDIEPLAMCVAQAAQSFAISGSGFLSVDGELPEVDVGDQTYVADSLDDCADLAVPGGGVESCSTAHVTIPEGALEPGTYPVVLRNPAPAQCASSDEAELEITPPPELFAVDPSSAQADTEVEVSLTGAAFQSGMTITLDADPPVEGQDVVVASATEASATFDLEGVSEGTYSVTVQNPDGCSFTLEEAFTVAAPVIFDLAGLEPPFGCTCERTSVTITSDGDFVSTPQVQMRASAGGGEVIRFERVAFVDASTVTAVVPEGAALGDYDVTVVNPPENGREGILEEGFRVVALPVPSIEAISPARGEPGDDVDVEIFGENFRNLEGEVRVELIDRDGAVAVTGIGSAVVDGDDQVLADGEPGQRITSTLPLDNVQQDIYLVRATNLDEETFSNFSNFQVASTGPDGNLAAFEPSAPLNTGRRMLAGADARDPLGNRHIYAIGGDTGSGGEILRSVEVAQLGAFGNLGSWDAGGHELQTPRVGAAAVTVPIFDPDGSPFIPVRTFLYVLGGMDESGNVLDTIERALVLNPDDAPRITSIEPSAVDGSLDAGTWYYRVSAIMPDDPNVFPDNPGGETLPSDEEILTIEAETGAIDLEWEPVVIDGVEAVAYRVYRTPEVNGVSNTQRLLVDNLEETSYTDTGADDVGDLTPLPPGATGVWIPQEEGLAQARWGHGAALVDDPSDLGDVFIHVLGGRQNPEGAAEAGYLSSIERSSVGRLDGELGGFAIEGTPIGQREDVDEIGLAFFSLAVQTPENVSEFDGIARFLVLGGVGQDADTANNQAQFFFEFSEVGEGGTNGDWQAYDGEMNEAQVRRAGAMAVIAAEKLFSMGGAGDVQDDLGFRRVTDSGMDVGFDEDGALDSPVQAAGETMNDPRALGAVVFRAGFIFFIGGTSDGEDALATVERTF